MYKCFPYIFGSGDTLRVQTHRKQQPPVPARLGKIRREHTKIDSEKRKRVNDDDDEKKRREEKNK